MEHKDKIWDVIIIGAGPTALAAAIYTTREDISTLLFEKGVIGGLAAITDKVDNYPGFSDGVTGMELSDQMRAQAERFGAQIELGEVQSVTTDGNIKVLATTSGEFKAKAVLIATGTSYKKLGIPGEEEFYGRGVHSCATCDGAFYRDKRLVVVGGGNSAVQETMFLTKFASHIDLLVRGESFRASDVLQQELKEHADKVTVHFNTSPLAIVGEDNKVTSVEARNTKDNEDISFPTDGVFVFIGLLPTTKFLEGSGVKTDEVGFVVTNHLLETGISGIYAAGDVRAGATMQIASATGEGATAALYIREYLKHFDK